MNVKKRSSSLIKPHVDPGAMKPIGILGGGQLARMMALKAHEMGLPIAVLSEKANDPAAQVTPLWRQGSLNDPDSLLAFLKACSTVTFESEFMDAELLAKLELESGTPIFPQPKEMARLQDRLSQKELIEKFSLPTAPFIAVRNQTEAQAAFDYLGGKVVFKKRRFGYDGYGTFVVRSEAEFKNFIAELETNPYGFIAEAFIKFRRELALMVARGRNGQVLTLPFVETKQENSRCLWVKGPLRESAPLKKLKHDLERFLKGIGYVGVMGVELFDTPRGMFINELAPRVHNSGHYSLDALSEDQFTIHLKAVLGHDLVNPKPLARGFAMMNLLGEHAQPPEWVLPPDIRLHWYGKNENRIGRKMGHINALGSTPETALSLVRRRRKSFNI